MNRDESLDVIKAIAIIFVVVGHFPQQSKDSYYYFKNYFIYYFHIPLFFIVLGVLLKRNRAKYLEGGFQLFLKEKTKVLAPYYFFLIIIGWGYTYFIIRDYSIYGAISILLTPMYSEVSLIWFLQVYYLMSLIGFYIIRFNDKIIIYLFLLITLIVFIFANKLNSYYELRYISLNLLIFNLPFLIFGLILNKSTLDILINNNNKFYYTILFSTFIIITLIISYHVNKPFPMNLYILFKILIAPPMFLLLYYSNKLLSNRLKRLMLHVGQASMLIYVTHLGVITIYYLIKKKYFSSINNEYLFFEVIVLTLISIYVGAKLNKYNKR